jgi:hypothetical protein
VKSAITVIAVLLLAPGIAPVQPAAAQTVQAPATAPFKTEEIDQLMAPIALYPDELIAQVLTAATYPLEIVMAARWVADPKNAGLKGDALNKALVAQAWDPSVKSLVPFPAVLKMMSDGLDWTQKLGDAFLANQQDCLASIQRLRQRAQSAGKLTSTPQQKVTTEGQTIVIQPVNPQIVYVPAYNPSVVYGTWPYPSYPPYSYPPPPGYSFVAGAAIGFAAGLAVNNNYWGWASPNWNGGTVNINSTRYNQINANRTSITGNTWQHNAVHRQGVAYRDAATRQQYGQTRTGAQARQGYRGYAGQTGAASAAAGRTAGTTPRASSGTLSGRSPGSPTTRPAGGAAAGRPSTLSAGAAAGGRVGGVGSTQPLQRQGAGAFNPGSGGEARAAASRGQASRQQMGSFAGGRSFGGGAAGGGNRGGGGGFRGGGGGFRGRR